MALINRFFGNRDADDAPDDMVSHSQQNEGAALQVVFRGPLDFSAAELEQALNEFHPELAAACCELVSDIESKYVGLIGWGPHVVRIVGIDAPMPSEAIEHCVAPSHYGPELKQLVREHRSHLLLWYAGQEESVLEQYVVLTAIAGVLERFGAIAVLNELASTSFPTVALTGKGVEGDILELLRTLPLTCLYCGLVKYDDPPDSRVWMRTFGASLFGLPDLASHTAGHHEGQRYFDIFNSILSYMLDTGRLLAAGHTMQLGADDYLRCRAPTEDEPWLQEETPVLVLEIIRANERNR